MPACIYCIKNNVNDHCYIGQTINFYHRWNQHKSKNPEQQIDKDIQKYGRENFKFEIIQECPANLLSEREKYWQDVFGAKEFGYSIK